MIDISSEADLEAVVGKTPSSIHLKVIDHLDDGALAWIACSPLFFATVANAETVDVTVGGGNAGFACGNRENLQLPIWCFDDPERIRAGQAWDSLFLLPHIKETLRVNGTVTDVTPDMVHVSVTECYGHCGKALIRSDFWSASPAPDTEICSSSFMALATADHRGQADMSPRGDPAGKLVMLDNGTLWFTDRPGNRRTDSLRNLLTRPQVAALLIRPGSTQIIRVSGRAELTTDVAHRTLFAVRDKTPHLAIAIRQAEVSERDSAALQRAALWSGAEFNHSIDAPRLFMDHIKINKEKELAARVMNVISAVPGGTQLFKKGLEKDYKDNLY